MNTPPSSLRFAGGLLLAASLAAALRGQSDATSLQPVVTTATRLPESTATLGSAVDTVSGAELSRRQLATVAAALSGVPGGPVVQSGQAGAVASAFLRGSNSNQTLFLVDGIRLNDSNTDYAVFLGGARLFPTDTLEIVRGPQSTLYGSEAIGGVISLHTQRGAGAAVQTIAADAGSFGTVGGTLIAQAGTAAWGYTIAAGGDRTDNARPNNRSDSGSLALRLDRVLTPYLSVGATLREFVERYGDPGDKYTNNPYDYEREHNGLATVFADGQISENFWTHLIVGGQDRRFDSIVPSPGKPDSVTFVKNRRGVLDWQVTGRVTADNKLTAGVNSESQSTQSNGFGAIDRHQNLFAWFLEDEWSPVANVYLTGGVRRDDYSTFGRATTERATLAWLAADQTVKLRASLGTGFDSPSFLDLYGQSAFYRGNPALLPEKSRGWDAGIDFYVPDGRSVVSATWFQTDIRNLIVFDFNASPATTANVNRARTEGLELALKVPLAGFDSKIAYTYLRAFDSATHTPLLRRPRNSASADLWRDLGRGFSLGVGGVYSSRRPDFDPATFGTSNNPGYTVVRAYAAWQVTPRLTLKARVENALRRHYEPVLGYPALGRGIFGGADYRF